LYLGLHYLTNAGQTMTLRATIFTEIIDKIPIEIRSDVDLHI